MNTATVPQAQAPVTAAIIVRDDPHLSKTVECLRPYVKEIVVVYTGPERLREEEIVGMGAIYDHFPFEVDEKGEELIDFSKARNRSFDLATEPWILWADSDDLIRGLEHLPIFIAQALEVYRKLRPKQVLRFCARYETTYDELGNATRVVVRERIVRNNWKTEWYRPVHERLEALADTGVTSLDLMTEEIVWMHQSPPGRSSFDRNIRILSRYEQKQRSLGIQDPQTYLDLGMEYKHGLLYSKAIENYERFIAISIDRIEIANACHALSELYWESAEARDLPRSALSQSLSWALEACRTGNRFEDYFAVATLHWLLGLATGTASHYHQALAWVDRARAAPTGKTYDRFPPLKAVEMPRLVADCHARLAHQDAPPTVSVTYGSLILTVTAKVEEASRRPGVPCGEAVESASREEVKREKRPAIPFPKDALQALGESVRPDILIGSTDDMGISPDVEARLRKEGRLVDMDPDSE